MKKNSRVPVLPPWERGLFGAGPDCPLVFVLPREDCVPPSPTLGDVREALEGEGAVEEEEEVVVAELVDEESEFCRSKAKW